MALDITGVGSVADLANTVINKIWPDKSEQEKQQLAAAILVVQGQLDINKAEAGNPSVFVAGWRPAIGWCCGAGLIWNYILRPAIVAGMMIVGHPVELPPAEMGELMPILLGMLGLGTLRTVEKVKGVA